MLEKDFFEALQINMLKNKMEKPEIKCDESYRQFFNFHDIIQTNHVTKSPKELNGTIANIELTNCNEAQSLTLLELGNVAKVDMTQILHDNLQELDDELEWSECDMKDNSSCTSSGLNENDALAELQQLPYEEILQLRNELKEITKQYSDVLIKELKNRDEYIREKELKNNFIASFLSVEEKLREDATTNTKNKFSLSSKFPNSQSFTTIPYEIKNDGPSVDVLEKLIEIMDAMRTNNPNVPNLLTNYILKVLCK
ncbi:fasciculation and elongation protein zeta-2-like isoform X2 [Xenia sp. Carnegie-2017]|nr:fasciculation and elongation protein zeta-2-like isoform X2 [Xenia sp. Carnegie-2017]